MHRTRAATVSSVSVTPLRAIVVDDEPLAREGLIAELARLGVDVIGNCGDGYLAHDAIISERPDVLFLDIEMPEVDGFALLERLEPEDVPPVVIFVTAYDQHALRAFEARALDYLLKPISGDRLRGTVERAGRRVQEMRALRDTATSSESASVAGQAYLQQLIVRDRDQTMVVPVADLEWVEAETYYVRLHTRGAKPRLLRERMSVLQARLDPAVFFRTHRSAIVRLELVRAIRAISKYEHAIVLSTGAQLPLSRERKGRLEQLLVLSS